MLKICKYFRTVAGVLFLLAIVTVFPSTASASQDEYLNACKAEARELNKTTWKVAFRDVPLAQDSYGYYILVSPEGQKMASRMYGKFPGNQEVKSEKDPNFHPGEKVKIFLEGVSYNECVWGVRRSVAKRLTWY